MWTLLFIVNMTCLALQVHDRDWTFATVALGGVIISVIGLAKE